VQEGLADTSSRGDPLELVDPADRTLCPVVDSHRAEGVEAVDLDPEVGVRQSTAELRRVDEEVECMRDVSARRSDHAQPPIPTLSQHASPT
jgi:hypothetical protein